MYCCCCDIYGYSGWGNKERGYLLSFYYMGGIGLDSLEYEFI